jgi:hypothetical protein
MTLDSLKNVYAGELKSLVDDNTVTVIMIEEGFSHLTQQLLDPNLVVLFRGVKRVLSNNLEIYIEATILEPHISIIGRPS